MSDVDRLLNAGADKISINSSAIRHPQLIDDIAKHFGSQVCVLAVDAKQTENGWKCYLNGGRIETDKELTAWTKEARGARSRRSVVHQYESRWCEDRICQ